MGHVYFTYMNGSFFMVHVGKYTIVPWIPWTMLVGSRLFFLSKWYLFRWHVKTCLGTKEVGWRCARIEHRWHSIFCEYIETKQTIMTKKLKNKTKQYRYEVVVVFFFLDLFAYWFFLALLPHFTSRLALALRLQMNPAAKHPTPSLLHKGLQKMGLMPSSLTLLTPWHLFKICTSILACPKSPFLNGDQTCGEIFATPNVSRVASV